MKEQIEKKISNHNFVGRHKLVIVICIIIALALAAILYLCLQKTKDSNNQQSATLEGAIKAIDNKTMGNEPQAEQELTKSADDYYDEGQQFMAENAWSEAVVSFSEAIRKDSKNPNYYNRKSQAEYNLGQKEQAIATLNEGLKNNPNNDLLKSRLDVLEKDYVGSQPQD